MKNIRHTTSQLIQSITQYCAADQLESVKIICYDFSDKPFNLPNQFRKVEKFEFICGAEFRAHLSVQFSESLRYLCLECLILDRNFFLDTIEKLKRNLFDNCVRSKYTEFH